MIIFVTIIHVIVCFILIAVILLQAGRGQGLSGPAFASGNVQSLLGTRANDFLTKATTVAAICFLFTCLTLDYLETQRSKSLFGPGPSAQNVNLDELKKALEKIQKEKASKPDALPAKDAAAAKTVAAEKAPAVQPPVTPVPAMVPAALPEVKPGVAQPIKQQPKEAAVQS